MKLKIILSILLLTCFSLNALELTEEEKQWIKDNPVVNMSIGYNAKFMKNKDGTFRGINTSFIELIEKETGLKFKLHDSNFKQALKKVKEKQVDAIFHVSKNPAREKFLNFTDVFVKTPQTVIGHENSPNINSLKDLCDKKVAITAGTNRYRQLIKLCPKNDFVEVKGYKGVMEAFVNGKANLAYDSYENIMVAANEMMIPNVKVLYFKYLPPIGYLRIGILKEKPILTSILTKAVDSMTEEQRDSIVRKWLNVSLPKENITELSDKEIKWIKENKKIKVRVANVPPLHFMEDNNAEGIAVDFIKYIGTKYNLDIEFIHGIPWNDALEKIKNITGEVDLLLSIAHSKEREKFINFTNEYIELPNMIYTRKDTFITSLNDLKGKSVVIEKGFLIRKFIKDANLNIKIIDAKNTLEALRKLSNGIGDAYIGDILIANYFIEMEQMKKIKLSAPTNLPLHTQSFGVRKDWPELASIINKGLLSMNEDEKQVIKGKWYGGKFEIIDYEYLYEVIAGFVVIIFIILYFLKQIKTKEEESSFLLNSVPVNIYYKDGDLDYIKINQSYADILKVNPEEVVGKSDYDFWPKELAKKFRDVDKQVLNSQEKLELEEYFEQDGEKHYINTLKLPIIKDGKAIGLLGIFYDVTKYKSALEEITEKDEMIISQSRNAAMGEMLSMIAHQWRQPLSVISMAVNNIKLDIEMDSIDKKNFDKYSEYIDKECQYLSGTINGFQDFFKPDRVKEKDVDIVKVMDDALDLIGKTLENHEIEVLKEYPKTLSKVDIYSRELMQVFINILKNSKDALESTDKEKKYININIGENDTSVIITIKDNGGGISKEDLPKIFDPYFSTKQQLNGIGLGLYISKTIVEKQLTGKIEAYNEDEGTVIKISILKNISK